MPFCSKCGKEIAGDVEFCSYCGINQHSGIKPAGPFQKAGSPVTPGVDNHLTKAILVTLLCCLPLGIAAIVQASSVNGKLQAGDVTGAVQASESANKLSNWSIGLGVAGMLIYFVMMIIVAAAGEM